MIYEIGTEVKAITGEYEGMKGTIQEIKARADGNYARIDMFCTNDVWINVRNIEVM